MRLVSITIMAASFLRVTAAAFQTRAMFAVRRPQRLAIRRFATVDDEGRVLRRRRRPPPLDNNDDDDDDGDGWDSFDPTQVQQQQQQQPEPRRYGSGGWQDDDEGWDSGPRVPKRPTGGGRGGGRGGRGGRGRDRDDRPRDRGDVRYGRQRGEKRSPRREPRREPDDRRINLRALELAGYDHLYGLSSVLNALSTGKRDFTRPEDFIDINELEGEELEHELKQRDRKPQAQFTPWLFVQDRGGAGRSSNTNRSADKAGQAANVLELAEQRGIPVATVDKGVLNTLSNNRPHQGYVLRCGKLEFESIKNLPVGIDNDDTNDDDDDARPSNNFWLVLDEVVDPQNFGALTRSAHFLGCQNILVCAKNSAPPTAVVSAASAGALELSNICSTSNLPQTLAQAEADGCRIVGASVHVPSSSSYDADDTEAPIVYDLQDLPILSDDGDGRPTILVLGSEGHGLRTLVARSCTEFVRIPSMSTDGSVDSLNVSVTGGILLWHFLQQRK